MTDLDSLIGIIEKIVVPMFKYSTTRIGKVVDNQDPDKEGKVLCQIPSLGWDTNDKGAWCFPGMDKGIKVPVNGTFVLIDWIDGNDRFPVYRGVPTNLKDQIPPSYNGDPKTNILFEGNQGDIIRYIEGTLEIIMKKEILLGDSPTKGVARVDDEVEVTIPAGTFLVSADAGVPNPNPVVVTGKVNEGSTKVKAGN